MSEREKIRLVAAIHLYCRGLVAAWVKQNAKQANTPWNRMTSGDKTMDWFGPSKDEVWRQLSQEIGAEFC